MGRRWSSSINAKLPYKTLAELIADAKANPKSVSFGTSGPASSPGMTLAQLNAAAKTDIVAVPYRGSGDAARAVAGGAIQGAFTFFSQAKPLVDDGKVRPLAVAAPKRIAAWPDVPTFRAGLQDRLPRLRRALRAGQDAEADRRIPQQAAQRGGAVRRVQEAHGGARHGGPAASDNTPEKYDAFMREEIARQGELAELAKAARLSRRSSGDEPPAPRAWNGGSGSLRHLGELAGR